MITKKQVAILKACQASYARILKQDERAQTQAQFRQAQKAMRKLQREYRKVLLDVFEDAMLD